MAAGFPSGPAEPLSCSRESTRPTQAVAALLVRIDRGRRQSQPPRLLRPKARPEPMDNAKKLSGWLELARTDEEALFGRGTPPHMVTVAVKRGLATVGRRSACRTLSRYARPVTGCVHPHGDSTQHSR